MHGVVLATMLCLLSVSGSSPPQTVDDWRAEAAAGLQKAISYLLEHQEPDGAFGHWRGPIGSDDWYWSIPGQHYSWQVATTAITCVTLMDLGDLAPEGAEEALRRGLDHVCENGRRKRIANWDTDNMWAYVYALEVVARALAEDPQRFGTQRRDRLRALGEDLIDTLEWYQSPDGGWSYYDNPPYTRRPTWGTSFVTASLLLIFEQCEQVGLEVPDKMQERGLRALRRCRLPNGAYDYNVSAIPSTRGLTGINQIKGSLCRIQVGNLALRICGDEDEVNYEQMDVGLEQLMRHHKFVSLARGRPFPHEAYYANSGYFFFYGHYYAAGVIELLPREKRLSWWPRLVEKLLATQESDGSMWDYSFFSYHRIYGTAWTASVLVKALREAPLQQRKPVSTQKSVPL
ncbi:MAG: hypothetical protein COB10_03695 [Planctomycetota bacterium]|nr:MAG: hypothetical protein COB10_03695 [Planctomycetota bacterium]